MTDGVNPANNKTGGSPNEVRIESNPVKLFSSAERPETPTGNNSNREIDIYLISQNVQKWEKLEELEKIYEEQSIQENGWRNRRSESSDDVEDPQPRRDQEK
uniref:Anaphase-promoting complex subunit 13 n=1 Tax=Caenorhabditis tropicalis TaxID=1561998 RepID=A0A1I7SY61_9PELO